jgi:hypothetical protein
MDAFASYSYRNMPYVEFYLLGYNTLQSTENQLKFCRNMSPLCSSEMSVDFQWTTRCYIPRDRMLHNHRCENLKSSMFYVIDNVTVNQRCHGIMSTCILQYCTISEISWTVNNADTCYHGWSQKQLVVLIFLPPDVFMLPAYEAQTVLNSETVIQQDVTLNSGLTSSTGGRRSSKPKQVTYECWWWLFLGL